MKPRKRRTHDRYETWHACESCNDEWEVYRTHRGASACPNCDKMAPAHRVYDHKFRRLTYPLRKGE